jgi:plastocyanin
MSDRRNQNDIISSIRSSRFIFRTTFVKRASKLTTMKTPKLIAVAAVSAGLAFGVAAQAKEHEEQSISSSDVPAAVQQAAETHAKGGKIVRWEKEGANYEAVIEKNGKELGFAFDANGKFLKKRDESKEQKGQGEKY